MSCIIDQGYALGCRDSMGGIKNVYIAEFDKIATYTETNGDITSNDTTTSPVPEYFKFEQFTEAATFAQTGTYSLENGTVFYDQQLTLMFHKQSTELRNRLLVLSQARMSIIIEDQNGNYWLVGRENGVYALSADIQSGKAFGDMNGITLVLQGKEKEPAIRILAADEAALDTAGFPIG